LIFHSLAGPAMKMRSLVAQLCPPVLVNLAAKRKPKPPRPEWFIGFFGRYATFAQARENSGHYDQAGLLDIRASRFDPSLDQWNNSQRLLTAQEVGFTAAVTYCLSRTQSNPKTILDFGGEFGLHYLMYRKTNPYPCRWFVAELPRAAKLGAQKWKGDDQISFHTSLDQIPSPLDLALASSSIQYTDSPYDYCTKLQEKGPRFLFIDRLPLTPQADDFCSVQRVGPMYYGVAHSLPAWFLSEKKFFAFFADRWRMVFQYEQTKDVAILDDQPYLSAYRAILFERIGTST
jgi:putative methyltransferase (TIGR04325 family)